MCFSAVLFATLQKFSYVIAAWDSGRIMLLLVPKSLASAIVYMNDIVVHSIPVIHGDLTSVCTFVI